MSEAGPAAPAVQPAGAVPVVVERRRQHPLGPLLRLQGVGQVLLVGLVAGGSGDGPYRLLTLVPILGLVAVRVVEWATTTYEVGEGALRMDSGVVTRRRREVPLDRVQQVDVKRGLRHRLFGLCQVTVDAASGSGGEVSLVLANEEAGRLRRVLSSGPAAGAEAAPAAEGPAAVAKVPEPATLVRLRPAQLALAGVTGAKQLVMLAILGSALQLVDDLPEGAQDWLAARLSEGTGWLVVAAFLALPAWFTLAALAQLATDLGFTLTSDGSVLHVRRGFPTEREATLGLDRVQVAEVEQTAVRRLVGVASVQLAAAGSGHSADAQVSRLTVPILPVTDVEGLLAAALPGATPLPALVAAPVAARRRQVLRRAVPAAVVAGVAALLVWPWGLVALVLVPLAVEVGRMAYAGLGHATTATHAVSRRGGLWRRTAVVPLSRVQSARVRQTVFQRRAGLATLHIDAAGRNNGAIAVDLAARDARRIAVEATTAAAARADERARRDRGTG